MFKKINNIEEGKWLNLKSFLVCLCMVLSFLLVPQIVGSLLYFGRGLNETVSIIIGNTVLTFLYIIVFFPTLKKQFKDFKTNFSDNFHMSLKYWGIGLALMLISNFILNFLVFPGEISENEKLNRLFIQSYPLIGFFEIVFLAPFIEELIFRFGLRKSWGKNKAFPIITALIFAFLHAIAGISEVKDLIYLLYIIPYGALGYAFGYLYNKSDNIYLSITAHMMHNFMTFILIILFA